MNHKFFTFKTSLKLASWFLFRTVTMLLLLLMPSYVLASFKMTTLNPPDEHRDLVYFSEDTIISGAEFIFVKNNDETFYVTSDTYIYGASNLNGSNIEVIQVNSRPEVHLNKSKIASTHRYTFEAPHETKREQLLKNVGVKVNAKVLATFYSSSQEQQCLNLAKFKVSNAVASSNFFIDCFVINGHYEISNIAVFKTESSKEDAYKTPNNVQSFNLNNLPLRGPPFIQ